MEDSAGHGPCIVSAIREQMHEQLVDLEAVSSPAVADYLLKDPIQVRVRYNIPVEAVQVLEWDRALMREDQGIGMFQVGDSGTDRTDP